MSEVKDTPWRKNLDTRYISGEDLKTGIEMGKGLRPEMVVTLLRYEDSPAFDQKSQKEVDKTALWLKDHESGKALYKPMLLNVTNGEFLEKEIGGGSQFINNFDTTKPFVIYALADRRHGYVARLKKYFPKATISPANALSKIGACTTMEELGKAWEALKPDERKLPAVLKAKDELKVTLGKS